MDKLTKYRTLIMDALTERANLMRSQPLPGEEIVCMLDEATDNYLILRLGWLDGRRLYSVTLHLRIVGDMVHFEQDWTDDFMIDLVDAGVARTDIVLSYNRPELPRRTEFAVA